jgi:outer membrane lipoprotein-sorting protein
MRSSFRWLVPVAVAATVTGGAVINSAAAGSAPQLPTRTPQQVLEAVASSNVTALSGTVVTRTSLGLPALPQLGGGASSSTTDVQGLVTRFLSGENTLRVWADGSTRQRVQLLDSFDELNVVRNGDQVWTYASKQNLAQHGVLPKGGTGTSAPKPTGPASGTADLTPAQLAQRALAAAGPTTEVTLATPELVAGRPAYALTLTPRTSATLVGHVVIAVDAAKGVPLQVQVFARGSTQPAIETGFTAIDFSTPAASWFTFTPPKGAAVTQLGDGTNATAPKPSAGSSATSKPTETGTGWTTVVELPAAAAAGALPMTGATAPSQSPSSGGTVSGRSASALLGQLTTPVSGGRALTSSLLSVLITTDGRVFAGAVPVQTLIDASKK